MTTPQTEAPAPPSPRLLPADADTAARMITYCKLLADAFAARKTELQDEAKERRLFRRKATIPVEHPADPERDLSLVSVTNPKPKAVSTAPAELRDWMLEHHDDLCRDQDIIVGSTEAVIQALREYAPDSVVAKLVTIKRGPADWAVEDILRASLDADRPVGPGGEIDDDAPPGVQIVRPEPTVQVRLAEDAIEHLTSFVAAGGAAQALGIASE